MSSMKLILVVSIVLATLSFAAVSDPIKRVGSLNTAKDPNSALAASSNTTYLLTDPNSPHPISDPNNLKLKSSSSTQSISGTLAAGWLYQGKVPPKPQVGYDKITFRTEVHPWPYLGMRDDDWPFRHGWYSPYGWWNSPYECWDLHRNNYNTYPVNQTTVIMSLDSNVSFEIGGYSSYDPVRH